MAGVMVLARSDTSSLDALATDAVLGIRQFLTRRLPRFLKQTAQGILNAGSKPSSRFAFALDTAPSSSAIL